MKTAPMEIGLHLRHHCIQTAARRKYEDLLRQVLKPSGQGRGSLLLEAEIEGLRFLLESCDFSHLRSRYPALSGREETRAVLQIPRDMKETVICCGGEKIRPKWRGKVKR